MKTKIDFYRRFLAGEFGNTSYHWSTYDAWRASKYQGEIAIRTRVQRGRCDYFIKPHEVADRIQDFYRDGYRPADLHFSAQCPEQDKILQGEVIRTPRGLYLFASRNRELAMRDALRTDSFELTGLAAHSALKTAMCPNSWSWLNHLLDSYPDHVVEFTTLRYPWGTVPGFNTLIWEVRLF